jgi:hypothetical protein
LQTYDCYGRRITIDRATTGGGKATLSSHGVAAAGAKKLA